MKRNYNAKPSDEQIDAVKCKLLAGLSWMDGFPADPSHLAQISRAYAKFVQNREHEREDMGHVNDLEWLVEQIGELCERFPMPIKAREIYEEFFTPADGRYSTAMGPLEVPE